MANTVPLNRVLSKMGLASRSQANAIISAGRVYVNHACILDPLHPVDMAQARITLDGAAAKPASKIYLALNKPTGLVTTRSDEQGRATVYDCLGEWKNQQGLAPVGRLDKASSGLLLFSNDTRWAATVTDPAQRLPKTYHVQINRHLTDEQLAQMRSGMALAAGEVTAPAQVQVLRQGDKTQWLEIVLEQGLNRQVRRMVEMLDAEVQRLIRVAIGPVALGDLPKGACRRLRADEVSAIVAPR